MQRVLKRYNKDALRSNIRNIEITYSIIRHQIKDDGFNIIYNSSWDSWYLVETKYTNSHCPSQGIFNVHEEIGKHSDEADLLRYYLETKM